MGYGWGGRGYGRRGWRRGRGGWATQLSQPIVSPPARGLRVATTLNNNNGLQSIISQVFARAPYLALIDIDNGQIIDLKIFENPAAQAPGGAGRYLAQLLLNSGVSIVLVPSLGPNAAQALTMAGVQVYNIQPGIPLIEALRATGLVKG